MRHVWHDNDHMMLFPEAVRDSHHIFCPSVEGDKIVKSCKVTLILKFAHSKISYMASTTENMKMNGEI